MTQWYAVFEAGTTPGDSDPISTGTVIDEAHLREQGRSWTSLPRDPSGLVWDRATTTFVAPPPAPLIIDRVQFMELFTLAERTALRTSVDPNVQDLIWHVNNATAIDLSSPPVVNGLAYLSANNLIAAGRQTQIEAGAPSGG